MVSQEKIVGKTEIQVLKKVFEYKNAFMEKMCKFYEGYTLTSIELYGNYKTNVYPTEPEVGLFIKNFGTKD